MGAILIMYKHYKVLEVIWYYNNSFSQDYLGDFETLEQAQQFVHENEEQWEQDLNEYAEKGIGIEIETWIRDSKEQDSSFDDLIDTYTEWCKDK